MSQEIKPANPWGLNEREWAALAALIEGGCNKAAARQMGIESRTVERLSRHARDKMARELGLPFLSRLQAAVHFDRFTRAATP